MDERSYKQRLVTRCDKIIGGGGRRLGENSVAPPIPLVGARARESARQERLWCPRMAPTKSRAAPSKTASCYVLAVIRFSLGRHRMLLPRLRRRWHKIARGRALDA